MLRIISSRIVIFLALLHLHASAQEPVPQPTPYSFDVVAIRPSTTDSWKMGMSMRDGTLQATNLYLKSIITSAYGVREGLISGLPAWAETARFDIHAKVVDVDPKQFNGMSRSQRQAMIAALLLDRFHLKVHTAIRTLPVYELVIAKEGPKFSEKVPPSVDTNERKGTIASGKVSVTKNEFTANDAAMLTLSSFLAETLDRTVIDKTGLTGRYNLQVKWTPDDAPASDSGNAPPSIFTALQEQLGLRLQSGKGPVETLVVDHIDPPSEN